MNARGFTLVELLVVLGVIALLFAVTAPIVASGLPGASLKTAASDVANGLRRAQSVAIVENVEVAFRLNVDSRRFSIGEDNASHQLPNELVLTILVGESEATAESVGGIRFFPDGSSTGGTVTLALEDRALDVSVDWLTGRVRVLPGERSNAP